MWFLLKLYFKFFNLYNFRIFILYFYSDDYIGFYFFVLIFILWVNNFIIKVIGI